MIYLALLAVAVLALAPLLGRRRAQLEEPRPGTEPKPLPEPIPSDLEEKSRPSPGPLGPPSPDAITWTKPDLIALIRGISEEESFRFPALAQAIAQVESAFDPRAINFGDRPPSVGLMQVKLPTAKAYVPWVDTQEALREPSANVRAGVRFLKDLDRKWFRDYGWAGVVQMYNLGETAFLAGVRSGRYLDKVDAELIRLGEGSIKRGL